MVTCVQMSPRRYALLALPIAAACASGETVPTLDFSTVLSDDRGCRDASITTIQVQRGDATPLRFVCFDTESPKLATATDVPIDEVDVLGLSVEGAPLYRGRLVARQTLGATPSLIVMYPYWAR